MPTENLTWISTSATNFDLRDQGNTVRGSLSFQGQNVDTIASGSGGPFNWTFGKSGFLSPTVTARTTNPAQEVASLPLNPFGSGTLNISGLSYPWGRPSVFSAEWTFRNSFAAEIVFAPVNDPSTLKINVAVKDAGNTIPSRDLLLMEMMGCYILILLKKFQEH